MALSNTEPKFKVVIFTAVLVLIAPATRAPAPRYTLRLELNVIVPSVAVNVDVMIISPEFPELTTMFPSAVVTAPLRVTRCDVV